MPFGSQQRTVSIDFHLEELGKTMLCVDVELSGHFCPGEPMVRYYPDGSGYPGSPDEFEFVSAYVTKAYGEDWILSRRDRPDWFEYLDKCIENKVYADLDNFEERCLERMGDAW